MDFIAFKDWALLGLLSGLIYIFWEFKSETRDSLKDMNNTMKEIGDSVDTLNVQMAVIVTRVDGHETRINNLEESK